MDKNDILNYVMNTPGNTNRAVLSGMLDKVSGTQLPSPTPSDNGKVLGVDEGEYKLMNGIGVSKIKIGEGSGGLRRENSPVFDSFYGGASVTGSAILEAIGDKNIIDIVCDCRTYNNKRGAFEAVAQFSYFADGQSVKLNPICCTKDDIAKVENITLYGLAFGDLKTGSDNTSAYVDIYAVCI